MRELTVQDVIDAYKKVGCRPIRGDFFVEDSKGRNCYCVLSALYEANGGDIKALEPEEREIDAVMMTIGETLGISYQFAKGIMWGWDGAFMGSQEHPEEVIDGFRFGLEARKAVTEQVEYVDSFVN